MATQIDTQRKGFCKKYGKVRTDGKQFLCSATGLPTGQKRFPAVIAGKLVGNFLNPVVANTLMAQYGLQEDRQDLLALYKQVSIPILVDKNTGDVDLTPATLRNTEQWSSLDPVQTYDEYMATRKKPSPKKKEVSLKVKKPAGKPKRTKLTPNVYALAATKTLKASPMSSEQYAKSMGRLLRDPASFKAFFDEDTGAVFYWQEAPTDAEKINPHTPNNGRAKGSVIAVIGKNYTIASE